MVLGLMPDWGNLARQFQLAQQAQTVVGKGHQMKDRIVNVKLARWQPFQIKIGLDLRVELLMHPVVFVQLDDFFRRDVETGHQPCNSMSGTNRR
jgi:hypothetical protein